MVGKIGIIGNHLRSSATGLWGMATLKGYNPRLVKALVKFGPSKDRIVKVAGDGKLTTFFTGRLDAAKAEEILHSRLGLDRAETSQARFATGLGWPEILGIVIMPDRTSWEQTSEYIGRPHCLLGGENF